MTVVHGTFVEQHLCRNRMITKIDFAKFIQNSTANIGKSYKSNLEVVAVLQNVYFLLGFSIHFC